MKLKVTNENYSAQIVRIKNPRKHSNADKLLCWSVNFNNVITDLSAQEGLMVYFPVECKISHKFLSENSIYKDSEMNLNKEKVGFFEKSGRVKAMRLRGELSEGLIMPLSSLNGFCDPSKLKEGDSFNLIDGEEVCEKYVPKTNKSGGPASGSKAMSIYAFPEGQFAFHKDTSHLVRNLREFNLDDIISISYKVHGTSFTSRRVLKNRKFWKFNLPPKYELVSSSRNTIKKMDCKKYDLWVEATKTLDPVIYNGLAIYGEIVGYNVTGGIIQSGYDYGCDPNAAGGPFNKILVYRITYTSPECKTIEFSTPQIAEFCLKNGLEMPKVFFSGSVRDYCTLRGVDITQDEWRKDWVLKMKEEFNEKDCFMCKNAVPEEGVVVRKEGLEFKAYKFKSSRFLLTETELFDKGVEILS